MPNPSVFSAEEREFLSDLVNDFVTTQAGATTADFLVNTYRDFVARWPNAAPTLSEILVHSNGKFTDMPSDGPDKIKVLAEAQTKAEDAVAAKMSNRIKFWFYNRTRGAGPSTRAKTPMSLKESKPLQDWQVYQQLYYKPDKEKQTKMMVDYNDWATTASTAQKKKKTYFVWLNEQMKKELATDKDIQEEVAEFMKGKKSTPKSLSEVNKARHQSIHQLPATLDVVLSKLVGETGWCATVMMGGPTPKLGGMPSTLMQGDGPDEKIDFFDWVDRDWLKMFNSKYAEYLAEMFPEQERQSYCLSEQHASSPASNNGTSGSSSTRDNTPQMSDTESSSRNCKCKRISRSEEDDDDEAEGDMDYEAFDKTADKIAEDSPPETPTRPVVKHGRLIEALGIPEAVQNLQKDKPQKEKTPPKPTAFNGESVPRRSPCRSSADDIEVDVPTGGPESASTASTGLPLPPEVLETYRLPPWISPELVEVMKLAIPGKLWEAIICLWLELECCAEVTNGSLPTAHRPEQVAFWIKAKHLPLKIPKGVTASGMASTWRHGANGFLYVILCLTWWGQAAYTNAEAAELDVAIIDVHWVVTQIALATKKAERAAAKAAAPPQPTATPPRPSKRRHI
ncbi:hypothetical protein CCMSSC00406_0006853 [Pleurotus cornucopiae]|uniref:Uncharacterized protein n=1 Tax=Pleurotus cornucopiae TaxID=5321 RepID=A0ACB7IPR2_PLECO|nr:hypothetical protein CCMSSC00406_0006853 [Pleurotus cornucopiae]